MSQLLFSPPSHLFPKKTIIYSDSQAKKLSSKLSYPRNLEFHLENINEIKPNSLKKLTSRLSKRVSKLKNPPLKETLKCVRIAKHLRKLEIKPDDASKFITKITRNFSRLNHLAILDTKDSFSPIRLKKKVYPMRLLRTFIYDHEFCRDFIKCARYAETIKIRKISLDFAQLKRFQRLKNIYIILKTKYLSLPEEDRNYMESLGKVLIKLPGLENVALEQEVDPENYPPSFMETVKILKDKAKVGLVADFVDVSNQRSKNVTVEKLLHTISESGIKTLDVSYVGVMKTVKGFGRSFYAPIHVKPELYLRFIKTIMNTSIEKIKFSPTVHSCYIDEGLRNGFIELIKDDSRVKMSHLTVVYNLDTVEPSSFDLLLDLYNERMTSYELVITSSNNLKNGALQAFEAHYRSLLAKAKGFRTEFSLHISVKNLETLRSLLQAIACNGEQLLPVFKGLGIQVTDLVSKTELSDIFEILNKCGLCNTIKQLGLDFFQKEAPGSEELFNLFEKMLRGTFEMKKVSLSYHNAVECSDIIKSIMDKLRQKHPKTNFTYKFNHGRIDFD